MAKYIDENGQVVVKRGRPMSVLPTGWKHFDETANEEVVEMAATVTPIREKVRHTIETMTDRQGWVPARNPLYVPDGNAKLIKQVVASGQFLPVFITGVAGTGKNEMVEQACAVARRNMVHVQITKSTDADVLLGSWTLQNGTTVFNEGPVLSAMKHGDVLFLDEIDMGIPENLSCLQSILCGKDILNPQTKEVVKPAEGFNILVAANTKGRLDLTGSYAGVQILNEAFLDRFAIMVEHHLLSAAQMKKLFNGYMEQLGCANENVAGDVARWVNLVYKTFQADGIADFISIRRAKYILQTYAMVQDITKAVELCTTRFDQESRDGMKTLFDLISSDPNAGNEE